DMDARRVRWRGRVVGTRTPELAVADHHAASLQYRPLVAGGDGAAVLAVAIWDHIGSLECRDRWLPGSGETHAAIGPRCPGARRGQAQARPGQARAEATGYVRLAASPRRQQPGGVLLAARARARRRSRPLLPFGARR